MCYFQNLATISNEYVLRDFKPAAAKAAAKTKAGNTTSISYTKSTEQSSASSRLATLEDDSSLSKLKVLSYILQMSVYRKFDSPRVRGSGLWSAGGKSITTTQDRATTKYTISVEIPKYRE